MLLIAVVPCSCQRDQLVTSESSITYYGYFHYPVAVTGKPRRLIAAAMNATPIVDRPDSATALDGLRDLIIDDVSYEFVEHADEIVLTMPLKIWRVPRLRDIVADLEKETARQLQLVVGGPATMARLRGQLAQMSESQLLQVVIGDSPKVDYKEYVAFDGLTLVKTELLSRGARVRGLLTKHSDDDGTDLMAPDIPRVNLGQMCREVLRRLDSIGPPE